MIRKNLFWKLFALAVSLVLWAHVNAERNPQARKAFIVSIEARNVPKGYIAEFGDTREATVTLHGPQSTVESIRREDVSAWVDVESRIDEASSEHAQNVHARVAGVAPSELDVAVSPKKAKVRIEAIRWKRLPVEVKFLSPPPLGYSYSEPDIVPSTVAISGKTSEVSKVRKVVIQLSGEHGSHTIDEDFTAVAVDAKGNVISNVNLDENTIHLKLRFVEAPATKAVIISPRIEGQPKFPAAVSRVVVNPPTVTLEGKPAVLMGLSTVSTEPINVSDITATLTRDAAVRMPANVRLVGHRSVRVTVYVTTPEQH